MLFICVESYVCNKLSAAKNIKSKIKFMKKKKVTESMSDLEFGDKVGQTVL